MGCYESNWVFNNSSKLHRRSFDYHTFLLFIFSEEFFISSSYFKFPVKGILLFLKLEIVYRRNCSAFYHLEIIMHIVLEKWSQRLLWNQGKLKRVYHVIGLGLHSELDSACNYTSAVKQFLTHFRCQGGQVQVAMLVVMVMVSCDKKNKSK